MPITTLRQLLDEATEKLNTTKVPDPRYDARALLMSAYQLSPAQYLLYEHDAPEALIPRVLPDAEALSAASTVFHANVDRRSRREPLQQILGTAGFYGLDFLVTKDVLCPRADTETLVDAVLGNLMPEQIGAVHAAPSVDPTCTARTEVDTSSSERTVDKCPDFLAHVDNDGASLLDVCTGSGCIAIALDGTADGLRFYRILAEESVRYLKPGGRIYLEIGYDQGERVPALLAAAGFQEVTVIRDFGGNDRVVAAHL